MERWFDKKKRELLSCSIFRVEEVLKESDRGGRGDFYILHAPDWVTVVPLTVDESGRDCFLMVEQYRHGSGGVTMEFPAGTVDPGEDPRQTAERELREETGYCAGTLMRIGALSPNPAFMSNTTYTYVARDLRYKGEQQLDVHESINIHLVSVEDVRGSMGTPPYNNAIMVAALALYEGCVEMEGNKRGADRIRTGE